MTRAVWFAALTIAIAGCDHHHGDEGAAHEGEAHEGEAHEGEAHEGHAGAAHEAHAGAAHEGHVAAAPHEAHAHEGATEEGAAHAAHDHGHTAEPAPLAPGENAVQAEMRALSAALASATRTFAEPDLTPIAHELHAVHAARERTDRAIASGEYHPPAGADRMERFRELDTAFHAELEDLVEASLANDRPRAGAALGRIVTGCEGCHSEFRRPPAP